MTLPTTPTSAALVVDANIAIAVAAKEANFETKATAELARYASLGYQWYAPGVIISETLYVLCGKHKAGEITTAAYATAVLSFEKIMANISPPPQGDSSLIGRAYTISIGYACNRSADGLYIAFAEQLAQTRPTMLLTFDKELPKQAAKYAPAVNVHLLII